MTKKAKGTKSVTPARPGRVMLGDLPFIGRAAAQALQAVGITSLRKVAQHSEADLLALHGVGPKAIDILREALAERGQSFAAATPRTRQR